MALEKQITLEKTDKTKEDGQLADDLKLINNFLNFHVAEDNTEENEKTILDSGDQDVLDHRTELTNKIKEYDTQLLWINDNTNDRNSGDETYAFESNKKLLTDALSRLEEPDLVGRINEYLITNNVSYSIDLLKQDIAKYINSSSLNEADDTIIDFLKGIPVLDMQIEVKDLFAVENAGTINSEVSTKKNDSPNSALYGNLYNLVSKTDVQDIRESYGFYDDVFNDYLDHVGSEEYLQKIKKEFGVSDDKAKEIQEDRLENLKNRKDFLLEKGVGSGVGSGTGIEGSYKPIEGDYSSIITFESLSGVSKISSRDLKLEGKIIAFHELGHVSVIGPNRDSSPENTTKLLTDESRDEDGFVRYMYAESLYYDNNSKGSYDQEKFSLSSEYASSAEYIQKKVFEIMKNWDEDFKQKIITVIKPEANQTKREYFRKSYERYSGKVELDVEMEHLGIKTYGEKFTKQHYEKLMESYDKGELDRFATNFIAFYKARSKNLCKDF